MNRLAIILFYTLHHLLSTICRRVGPPSLFLRSEDPHEATTRVEHEHVPVRIDLDIKHRPMILSACISKIFSSQTQVRWSRHHGFELPNR